MKTERELKEKIRMLEEQLKKEELIVTMIVTCGHSSTSNETFLILNYQKQIELANAKHELEEITSLNKNKMTERENLIKGVKMILTGLEEMEGDITNSGMSLITKPQDENITEWTFEIKYLTIRK